MANLVLPKSSQVILGKPRHLWVHDAAKGIIATTDLDLRWNMVLAGPDEFLRLARPLFHVFAGFEFTADEMRWAFWRIKVSLPPMLPTGPRRLSVVEEALPWGEPDIMTDTSPYKVEPR